jgi:cytochrome bd-type quinol oxidase subunit 1
VYELPLLPNNTASETFVHKLGAVRSAGWIFISGAPAWRSLGEHVILDKKLYNIIFKQEAITTPVAAKFSSLSHCERPLLVM